MRILGASVAVVGGAMAASLLAVGTSGASEGTGVYADWAISGTTASATFDGTAFPSASAARTNGSWQVASGGSTWLSVSTPFGAEYGSSQGRDYLYTSLPLGGTSTTVTVSFATPPAGGTWGFALGDIDAEDIAIAATDATGAALDVADWYQGSFNYCAVSPKPSACPSGTHSDQPTWTAPSLLGAKSDTNGAAAWFQPTAAVSTLTFTQTRNVSGAPIYQLWIAADVQAEASASPSVTETCTTTTTALTNGGFEQPTIPAKSYRQLNEADVPGWQTTATDRKIEIWSTGFNGVTAPEGDQFAELNATQPSELYQTVETVPGQTLTWSLLHRARAKGDVGDTMSVRIGAEGQEPNATYTFTDALPDGWVRHTGDYTVPEGQTRTRFGFESGPTASGSKSVGNFLDDIYFTTAACLPDEATEGNVVMPSASPSPTPSATESGSPSPTPTDSASDSASPTPTDSASASASDSASPTPTDSAAPTGSATPTATPSPSPSPTATATTPPTPVVVTPDRPTQIDVITDSGSDPGSTITSVDEPRNGTAEVKDNTVIYTPDPGFIGRDLVVTYIKDPAGNVAVVRTPVQTGLEQKPLKPLGLPAQITPNRTVTLIDHSVETNAGQTAKVTARCEAVTRMQVLGGFTGCMVTRYAGETMVTVTGSTPYRVRVIVTAPAKGDYLPYRFTKSYTVRP